MAGRATVLALSFAAFVMIGANDGGTGVLLPSLQATYGVDKATIGLIFLAATGGYLCAAFSSGLLVERLGIRRFLLLGTLMFILGAGTLSLQVPFLGLLAALLVTGFGVGILDAGLNAYIAALPDNSGPLNYLHACYGAGALIGPLVASGVLAASLGWPVVYAIWTGAGLLLLLGLALRFPRPVAPAPHEQAAQGGNVLAGALRLGAVWLAAAFLLAYVGAEVSLGSWSYSLLTETRQIDPLPAGWMVSGYWLGLTLGRIVLGKLSARVGPRRLITSCLAGVAAGLVIIWVGPGPVAAAAGLVLTGFALGPIFPTTIAIMPELVPARLLPSAIGFMASAGSAGAAVFPWGAGVLAQQFGLGVLLPYVLVFTVLLVILWRLLENQRPDVAPAAAAPGA
jgi:fucose permease